MVVSLDNERHSVVHWATVCGELEALEELLAWGKPLLLVLNRSDCWSAGELDPLLASIRRRLLHCQRAR